MTLPLSWEASAVNFGRAGLCFATRLTTEFEKASNPLPLPACFRKFAKNKAASMIVNGSISLFSATFAAVSVSGNTLSDYFIPASLGAFSLSSFALGAAASIRKNPTMKSSLDALGFALGSVGLCMAASPGTPAYVFGVFGLAALSAIALAMKKSQLMVRFSRSLLLGRGV